MGAPRAPMGPLGGPKGPLGGPRGPFRGPKGCVLVAQPKPCGTRPAVSVSTMDLSTTGPWILGPRTASQGRRGPGGSKV